MPLASRRRSLLHHATLWLTLAALAGCASGPSKTDGPEAKPPAGLVSVPDAEPRIEPIRSGGPNKPYEALGREYKPFTDDRAFSERGLASWYGRKFHGRRTASGEVYDMYAMSAAHPTLPLPSYVRVRNPANGREVIVRVNDRGPFHGGRVIDLSYTAALRLDLLRGVAPVEVTRITASEIRSGAWRKGVPVPEAAPTDVALVKPPAPDPAPVDDVPLPATTRPTSGFWVQLGAFRQREGADSFQRRVVADLDWLAPLLAVVKDASMFRLQAGPYASRDEAQVAAQRVRDALQLVPVIVDRR
ncbi:MAG TPA: septal ring lytic transglycosylase RlpA family protein [Albitalea sp.]|nr:septal ring lytic transglycosylase RlpA family protein [Albitalea sp.]